MTSTSDNRVVDSFTDLDQMIPLFDYAVAHRCPVTIRVPDHPESFYTAFVMKSEVEVDAMQRGEYLVCASLQPPHGNIKLRSVPVVQLHFFTDHYRVDLETSWLEEQEDHKIRLSFPHQVVCQEQGRRSPRVKISPAAEVQLSVAHPGGGIFNARIQDISLGGISFYPVDPAVPRLENAKIRIRVASPELAATEFHAGVMGNKVKKNHIYYRAYFLINNPNEHKSLESLIALVRASEQVKEPETHWDEDDE